MNRSRRSRAVLFVTCALLCLGFVLGAASGVKARSAQLPANQTGDYLAPSLTVSPYDQANDVLSVRGKGFTPGGKVYVAIYDQMGKQLYEHRWATASTRVAVYESAIRSEYASEFGEPFAAGVIFENFTGLCGASALIRALDDATERWSNWQIVQPLCNSAAGPTFANDLLRPDSLPMSTLNPAGATIANDLNTATPPALLGTSQTSDQGKIVVAGEGFTAGGRVYVAIYDQMGALLFETRWTKATPAVAITGPRAEVPEGFPISQQPGGNLTEAFADLCGAHVMLRAYDVQTTTWSNWANVAPFCELAPQGYGPH